MTYKRTITRILTLMALLSFLPSCSEKEHIGPRGGGRDIIFSVGAAGSEASKAAYAGNSPEEGCEQINWEIGDQIRIYCAQVSEPAEKYADYTVTEVISGAGSIDASAGSAGLCWGDPGDAHVFYAAYPSPTEGGITTDLTGKTVQATLPAMQAVVGDVTGTDAKVAAPDLKNMLMVSTATVDAGSQSPDNVRLTFCPLTTALEFTIKNGMGKEMKLKSVSLISGNKKGSAPAINGSFRVDLDTWATPPEVVPFPVDAPDFKITYTKDYPACTRDSGMDATEDMNLRTSTIDFSGQQDGYLSVAKDVTLTFTFFLVPTRDLNDLTFKLTYSDGSWMSTRLGYTDGTGIYFPRLKKTQMAGLLVPEGAQWYVKYGPTVAWWGKKDGGILPFPPIAPADVATANPDGVPWESGETADLPFPPIAPADVVTANPDVVPWDGGENADLDFHTKQLPPGALPGGFSVSDDGGATITKVLFSKGNLYYDGSVFRFEDNQYDFVPSVGDEYGESEWDPYHISHFHWSMDKDRAIAENPSEEQTYGDYDDIFFTNWTETTAKSGFTVNVEGQAQTGWRTLSIKEWEYLFLARTVNGGTGKDKTYSTNITYGEKIGIVLYPDDYTGPVLSDVVEKLPEGVVFLPATGQRLNDWVQDIGDYGQYWSSSSDTYDQWSAYCVSFSSDSEEITIVDGILGGNFRTIGNSVRLIRESK